MLYSDIGKAKIAGDQREGKQLPFEKWVDFPLFFTIEYPVSDFYAEVGFYAHAFGLDFLSVNEDYAIVRNPDGSTFSFQRSAEEHDLSFIKVQWFTKALDQIISVLKERGVEFEVLHASNVQRIVQMKSPNGIRVEIWSGNESA